MSNKNVNSSTTNKTKPKIKILREKTFFSYNPWWMITSFLITVCMSLYLYIAVDYTLLETLTRNLSLALLQWSGVPAYKALIPFPMNTSPTWGQFGEATLKTPGIEIPGVANYNGFWVLKACTGMQAGAILISLIYVTPLPLKGKLLNPDISFEKLSFKDRFHINHSFLYSFTYKTIIALLFFILLFIGNSVRIWFHLWLVGAWGLPFSFAHDDLSKPIGFIGTILFAWLITKSGIPIMDTFADWMDAAWLGLKYVYKIIV